MYGRRTKSLGPKPLWAVDGRETVFDCQLRVLGRGCTERPVVVGGFEFHRLRDGIGHLATVVENREWEKLGCGCSAQFGLWHARPGRVVVAHGDALVSPFDIPPSGSWLIAAKDDSTDAGEVGVAWDGPWATNLDYGVRPQWAQLVVMDLAEREIFQDLPLRHETLHEAVNGVIEAGGRFGVCAPSGLVLLDVDRLHDLPTAKLFRERHLP